MTSEKNQEGLYGKLPYPKRTLVGLAGATVAVAVWLWKLGAVLTTCETPRGIVDLELAGSVERVVTILGVWGQTGLEAAIVQTWIDFLFLLLYPATLSLACWLLSNEVWRRIGRWMSGLVLLAGLLDAAENLLMTSLFRQDFESWVPIWTAHLATAKFRLVIAAGLYLALGGAAWLWRADRPSAVSISSKIET